MRFPFFMSKQTIKSTEYPRQALGKEFIVAAGARGRFDEEAFHGKTLLCIDLTDAKNSEFGDKKRRRFMEIAEKAGKRAGSEFACCLFCGNEAKFLFLAENTFSLEMLRAFIGSRTKLKAVASAVTDGYEFYKNFLPTAEQLQRFNNEEILFDIRALGDIGGQRRVNFHLAFRSEPDTADFAPNALREGFALGSAEESSDDDCSVGFVVHRICELTPDSVGAATDKVIALVAPYGGKLLYWDCPIQKRLKK